MKFVETNTPQYTSLDRLKEFMNLGVKYAKVEVEEGEYKSDWSAYISMRYTVRKYKLPVKVFMHNKEIFIENKLL